MSMNIDKFEQCIGAFNKKPWVLRYVVIVMVVYIPGILVALDAGTFSPSGTGECEFYFITDYTFHYSWAFIVPVSLLIFPLVYRNMDLALRELSVCNPPIIDENLTESTTMRKWGKKSFQLLTGTALGFATVTLVGFMNYLSLFAQDRTQFNWWLPKEGSYAAFVYFHALGFFSASMCYIFLVRLIYVIRLLREGVLRISELPTWVGSPESKVDTLFRSIFLLCIPGSTISISIVITRIAWGMKPWDFTLLFNLFTIPFAFVIGLIFPVIYCGIPRKFSQQRSKLLWDLDKKIAELMRSVSEQTKSRNNEGLFEDMETLIKHKDLIKKNYPRLPLGSITKKVSAIPIGISAALPLIALVKMAITLFSK
jgi:hypothetical protein